MVVPHIVAMDAAPANSPQLFPVDVAIMQPHAQPEVSSTPLNTCAVPVTPPSTNQPLPQSTPIKIGTSTTCPFTTNQKYRVESCTAMGEEMEKYLVRPMPIQQFLDEYFPISKLPNLDAVPLFSPGCYHDTVSTANETSSYKPFVSLCYALHYHFHIFFFKVKTMQGFTPNLRVVNSSSHVDCNPNSDFSFKIKPDVSIYCADSHPSVKTDSSLAELFIEFKWDASDDPFCDTYNHDCSCCNVPDTKSFLHETKLSWTPWAK